MGWAGRLFRRKAEPTDADLAKKFSDVGVPELTHPSYARALMLDTGGDRTATVEVQPPGQAPYRAELRSGTTPGSLAGLVIRWHWPVVYDAQQPDVVYALEPPCGPDLPLISAELQAVRDARDLRTTTLAEKYPPPSAAQLFVLMRPTASAVHPAWDAVCSRMGLMTTTEAQAVLDNIRADGNGWDRAQAHLYSWGPDVPDDLRLEFGKYISHLYYVAPQGRELDRKSFWTLGIAALMRGLKPSEVEPAVFERVMRPFTDACGPLPDSLL